MDTFVCSSWYYLRFLDPQNKKEFCNQKKIQYWMPIDLYVGGAEHAVMHLLYARFIYKVLCDASFIALEKNLIDEPFQKLRNQGLILAEDGRKMSKSLGNVVSPDEVVKNFGADTIRLFEMFLGPLEDAKPWDMKAISGARRFLERIYKLVEKIIENKENLKDISGQSKFIHKTIKQVTADIKKLKFNTAISKLMIQFNGLSGKPDWINKVSQNKEWEDVSGIGEKAVDWSALEFFLKLLAPFAPHLTEELWEKLGHKKSIFQEKWPEYNQEKAQKPRIDFIVQINGKVRDIVEIEKVLSEEEIKQIVLGREKIKKWIQDKEIKKIIFVPDRLVNLVI